MIIKVEATGGALKYQWYKGVSLIPKATEPIYVAEKTQSEDEGNYFVVISNDKGITTSKSIKVSFGARASMEFDGVNVILKIDPGDKRANWKLQRSTDLLFWEDIQNLSEQDLIGLEKVIEGKTEFYRVVEY